MTNRVQQLKQRNNELDKQIDAQNKEAYTNMICYLCSADISEYDQELVRHDLLEMVLSAQKRGDTMKAVIGEDYKAFCDNIIDSLPAKTFRQKLTDFFDIACFCLSILLAIKIVSSNETFALIRSLINGNPLNFDISFSVGNVIFICMIPILAVIIFLIISKNSFKISKENRLNKIWCFITGVVLITIFLLIAWVGKASLFTLNIFFLCALTFVLYMIHRLLERL